MIRVNSILLVMLLVAGRPECLRGGVLLDPIGDSQIGLVGQGVTDIDIASLEVSLSETLVEVVMKFNPLTPIAPPSASAGNSLFGLIEFDLDLDSTTGISPGFIDFFAASLGHLPLGLGVDAVIFLASEAGHPGSVEVLYPSSGLGGSGTIQFSSDSLTIRLDRSFLLGSNEIAYAALVGDIQGSTDATAVGLATASAAVPEPGTLGIVALAASMLVARGRFRRR